MMVTKSTDAQTLTRYVEFMRRRLASASTLRQRAIRAIILVMAEAEAQRGAEQYVAAQDIGNPRCGAARSAAANGRAAALPPPF